MDPIIQSVYLMESEDPGDVVYAPSGIVVSLTNQKFTVYSNSADHNRLRNVLSRFAWAELLEGVQFRDTEYRLTDLTEEMTQHGWSTASAIPAMLRHLYESKPRHLFFLKRHVELNV
jgi:hypothetical protein